MKREGGWDGKAHSFTTLCFFVVGGRPLVSIRSDTHDSDALPSNPHITFMIYVAEMQRLTLFFALLQRLLSLPNGSASLIFVYAEQKINLRLKHTEDTTSLIARTHNEMLKQSNLIYVGK